MRYTKCRLAPKRPPEVGSLRQDTVTSPFPDGEMQDAAELGAVDSQSVRVWVRQPGRTEVVARLEVEGEPPVNATAALSADCDWTAAVVLALPRPAPGQPFRCHIGTRELAGRLAPGADSHAGLVFGFGSCNRPFDLDTDGGIVVSEAAEIYPAMLSELTAAAASLLLLIGDQIYSDELEPISVRRDIAENGRVPHYEEALAAYRSVSRGYLGQVGFRRLREAFPTLCVWDDHDIFKTWGSRLEKTPVDQRMFEAAARVYCEYQHQRNPGGAIGTPPYNYTYRWGDIGFLVLDVRGARDYQAGRLLGAEQMDAVRVYLKSEDAATLQTLFVVSSIPVAHVSRWMAKFFDRLPGSGGDQIRDRWCSGAFVRSRDELLERLLTWQTGAPTRQVVLLSGDVHAASAFTIKPRTGRGRIVQFTSSAFTSPHTSIQRVLNGAAVRGANLFEPRYRFRRHLGTMANNFAIVRVSPLPAGGHAVSLQLRAWDARVRNTKDGGRLVSVPDATR